jgi:hypothetical protein
MLVMGGMVSWWDGPLIYGYGSKCFDLKKLGLAGGVSPNDSHLPYLQLSPYPLLRNTPPGVHSAFLLCSSASTSCLARSIGIV